jgi:ABC-2 type transport system permease protein
MFFPIDSLQPALRAIAYAMPTTYAVSLMRGVWNGEGWIAHAGDVAMMTVIFLVLTVVSARVFRWE